VVQQIVTKFITSSEINLLAFYWAPKVQQNVEVNNTSTKTFDKTDKLQLRGQNLGQVFNLEVAM
jgi:hypothetical protein